MSTLVVVLVVVALLGVPLALEQRASLEDSAKDSVRTEALRIAQAVDLALQRGERIDVDRVGRLISPGHQAEVTLPGSRVVTAGAPVPDPAVVSRQRGAGGEQVVVREPATAVRDKVRDAVLLITAVSLLAVGAAVGLAVLQARRLARPLVDLARRAEQLGSGDPRAAPHRSGVAEVDRVADVLDASAARIGRMLAAERQLASDASHQLRTPLTALSMRLEEIVATDDPRVVREEAGVALAQVERLTDVVQRLLTNARNPGGSAGVPVDVDFVVRQQLAEWGPAYAAQGRSVLLTGERGLKAVASPGGLAQVLATLVENSLEHGAGALRVRTRRSGTSVVVEVADEGPGVPAQLGQQVFERSVSGRAGTGLGLAVARDLAEADGGRLELLAQRPPVFAVFLPSQA